MKQISEVEGNPFTSSLNSCPEKEKPAVERGGGGRSNASPPLFHLPISQLIRGYLIQRRRNRYSPPRCFLHVQYTVSDQGRLQYNRKCRHITFDHEPDMSQGGGGCKEGCSSLPLHPTLFYRWLMAHTQMFKPKSTERFLPAFSPNDLAPPPPSPPLHLPAVSSTGDSKEG
jgi:hypothetical protein